MPRTVVFIPEVHEHKHQHEHHHHGDYGDDYGFIFTRHTGLEGRFIGEEGGILIAGRTEEEVHASLDRLKPFMHKD